MQEDTVPVFRQSAGTPCSSLRLPEGHPLEHDLRIAAWSRTSVYSYRFHNVLPLFGNNSKN
jgi:hypothetical protein